MNKIPPINLHSIARQSIYEEFLYSLPWINRRKSRQKEDKQNLIKEILNRR